ncbi:hypothetical protein CN448_31480 [Bacillus cereus]|nr:hypothetical protein CN448_31480 [Bacillus cereus]
MTLPSKIKGTLHSIKSPFSLNFPITFSNFSNASTHSLAASVKSTPEIQHAIISSITWDGHQFLDNIREKSIWEATKIKAATLGSVSLPTLSELAKSYIAEKLGLN